MSRFAPHTYDPSELPCNSEAIGNPTGCPGLHISCGNALGTGMTLEDSVELRASKMRGKHRDSAPRYPSGKVFWCPKCLKWQHATGSGKCTVCGIQTEQGFDIMSQRYL